jgi:hypothetical protein
MTRSFETLGFLSSETDEFRGSVRAQFGAEFDDVKRAAATAIADLHLVNGKAPPCYLVGTAFWLRCIESCQGTVLLVERGLATSPFATLRTALECLFSACALWRKPEVAEKMHAWHDEERVKQAKQILFVGAEGRVTPEGLAQLNAVAAEQPPSSGWSHWEAACAAELQFEYAMMYRGLGIGGAHASPRSLDDFYTAQVDGSLELKLEPTSERLAWLLGLVGKTLKLGIARHREARNTFTA